MAELARALPRPTPETKPYWDGLKDHKLLIQRCNSCKRAYFYPRPFCPKCFTFDVQWFEASGKAKLYSFVINHRPAPGFGPEPYVIAIVELDEGPRMMSNLIGIDPDPNKIRCDMRLQIAYEDVSGEITRPKFRPA